MGGPTRPVRNISFTNVKKGTILLYFDQIIRDLATVRVKFKVLASTENVYISGHQPVELDPLVDLGASWR